MSSRKWFRRAFWAKNRMDRIAVGFHRFQLLARHAPERHRRLLERFDEDEVKVPPGCIEGLTDTAAKMRAAEKEMDGRGTEDVDFWAVVPVHASGRGAKIACLAPSVALR